MSVNQFFEKCRSSIEGYVREFISCKKGELSAVNIWGKDLMGRFSGFITQGKMIRGGLVILSYLMFEKDTPGEVIKTAAAIELIHSSLLIHDDIMDRDHVRRGEKTIFSQYEELGKNEGHPDPGHFGVSFGICAGDIGFFIAFEIISELQLKPEIKEKICTLWSKELVYVGLAQMQDIYLSNCKADTEEDEILNLYRYKTARYTFSLPLMTGALLAGQDEKMILCLEKIGERMGIIFQIKDDELGLFGTEKEIGKPVGTDIEEGKKTLFSHYLLEMTSEEDKKIVEKILIQKQCNPEVIQTLRHIAEKSGVLEKILKKMLTLKDETQKLISSLDVEATHKNILLDILKYNIDRKK